MTMATQTALIFNDASSQDVKPKQQANGRGTRILEEGRSWVPHANSETRGGGKMESSNPLKTRKSRGL